MKKFFINFDIFSKEFHLTYKGKNKFQTEFGGLLTIIAMIIILFNSFLIGKDIFLKENPTILTYEKNLKNSPVTRINYKNMFFGVYLTDKDVYHDDSIITIIPSYEIRYFNRDETLRSKSIILELTDCASEFKSLNLSLPILTTYFKVVKCIKSFDLLLSGSWKENPILYLNFQVRRCENDTKVSNEDLFDDQDDKAELSKILTDFISSNQLNMKSYDNKSKIEEKKIIESIIFSKPNYSKPKVICKSQQEITEKISTLNFNFFYNKITFNSKSYQEPFNLEGGNNWIKLGNSIYKDLIFQFNHYILSTDNGWIFNDASKEEIRIGYQKHSVDFSSKTYDHNLLMNASIYISDNVQYLNRGYIKVQNIFAELGGFIKLIFFVFQVIYDPFFNRKLKLKFMNKIYDFDHENFGKKDLKNITNLHHHTDKNLKNKINQFEIHQRSILYKCDLSDTARSNLNLKINTKILRKKMDIIKSKNLTNQLFVNNGDMTNIKNKKSNFNNNCLKVINDYHLKKNVNFIEKKINGKKLKFRNIDIVKILYCGCICKNRSLEEKNAMFNWADENLYDYTDFLKNIKLHIEITRLKYFFFNKFQSKSLEYINNPKKTQNGIFHHNNDFAEFFQLGKNKIESKNDIAEYFKNRIKNQCLNELDQKILDVIDPDFKSQILTDSAN